MYIRLDVFAGLLKVRPGALLHAVRTTGELEGLLLPARHQVRGAAVMFNQAEAIEFAARWHVRETEAASLAPGENLVPLEAFARRLDIPPQALWLAVSSGRRLRGLRVPAALKKGEQLLFEPAAVEKFVTGYHNVHENE
jgi:hypothetical protein